MYSVFTFLSFLSLGYFFYLRGQRGSRILRRITNSVERGSAMAVLQEVSGDTVLMRLAQPVTRIGRIFARAANRRNARTSTKTKLTALDVIRDRLVAAGQPVNLTAEEFYSMSIGLGGVIGVLLFLVTIRQGAVGMLEAVAIGFAVYRAPTFWLGMRISERQRRVRQDLLGWMDQLSTVTQAGSTLSEAIRRVSESMIGGSRRSYLAEESYKAWAQAQAGGDLGANLAKMADLFNVDELSHVISVLRQQMNLGTGVSDILRNQTKYLRSQRKLRMEEASQKATAKLLLPTMLVLAGTMLVVMYPAFHNASGMFGK